MDGLQTVFFQNRSGFEEKISPYLGNSIFTQEKITRLDRVSFLGIINYLEGIPKDFKYTKYRSNISIL
jgi:hypothetical protein